MQGVTFLSRLSCFFPIIPIVPSIRGYTQGCTNAIPTCFYYLRGIIRLDPQMFLRLLARVLSRKERDVLTSFTYLLGRKLSRFFYFSRKGQDVMSILF